MILLITIYVSYQSHYNRILIPQKQTKETLSNIHGCHTSFSFKTKSKTQLHRVFSIVSSWHFGRGTSWFKKGFDSLSFKAVREVFVGGGSADISGHSILGFLFFISRVKVMFSTLFYTVFLGLGYCCCSCFPIA